MMAIKPTFQRRHYQAIAEVIARMSFVTNADATRHYIVCLLADMFEADNPNFKRSAFLDACGIRE